MIHSTDRAPKPSDLAAVLRGILSAHDRDSISMGPVVSMLLPLTNSRIVRKNSSVAHCFFLRGAAGLFRKDIPETRHFGRHFCDLAKESFECDGFFTTDEIPKYGLTLDHKPFIALHSGADPDEDLTVITLYDRAMAHRISGMLNEHLNKLLCYG